MNEVEIVNPISSDLNVLRSSIFSNLIIYLKKNLDRGFKDISLFEIGPIFNGNKPGQQKIVLAGLKSGKVSRHNWIEKEKIPCGPIFNIKEAVENPQIKSRNMIVDTFHKVVGDFKTAGNPIKMSSYKDETKRGDIPDLDEHRKKIIEEFCN